VEVKVRKIRVARIKGKRKERERIKEVRRERTEEEGRK